MSLSWFGFYFICLTNAVRLLHFFVSGLFICVFCLAFNYFMLLLLSSVVFYFNSFPTFEIVLPAVIDSTCFSSYKQPCVYLYSFVFLSVFVTLSVYPPVHLPVFLPSLLVFVTIFYFHVPHVCLGVWIYLCVLTCTCLLNFWGVGFLPNFCKLLPVCL